VPPPAEILVERPRGGERGARYRVDGSLEVMQSTLRRVRSPLSICASTAER
jgi:hypothetical protein